MSFCISSHSEKSGGLGSSRVVWRSSHSPTSIEEQGDVSAGFGADTGRTGRAHGADVSGRIRTGDGGVTGGDEYGVGGETELMPRDWGAGVQRGEIGCVVDSIAFKKFMKFS